MKSFESWTFEDVEIEFQIERNYDSNLIEKWLQSKVDISENIKSNISILKTNILKNINTWNEDELKFQFISPLLWLVDFNNDKYKPFTQRSLTLKTDKIEVSGIIDFMIATGKVRPKEPLLFIHEYKQQHPTKKNDPLGQLLIAMVAAQLKNKNKEPVYGVLVEGRFWYFVILKEKEYAVCNPYDACTDSIYQIYSILCKAKEYFEEILAK